MGECSETEIVPGPYQERSYETPGRFASYWHQIDEVRRAEPRRILEVGMGNGFVADYLDRVGYEVVTLDVNPSLDPDVIGSITAIPFEDDSFDVVTACQVIEHIPFDLAKAALAEVGRVARLKVVLSMPDRAPSLRFHTSATGSPPLEFVAHIGLPMPRRLLSPDHEWELGLRGYPMRRFRTAIRDAGLRIERTFRVFQNPTCRFFVLERT